MINIKLNPEFLLDLSMKELYPISDYLIDSILKCINATPNKISIDLPSTIINKYQFGIEGVINDYYVVICKEERVIKVATLLTIVNALESAGFEKIILIASKFSKDCFKIRTENTVFLPIIELVSTKFKGSFVSIRSTKSMFGPTKVISFSIPQNGYPEFGFPGNLNGKDIKKIIMSKPVVKNNTIIDKAFSKLFKAFKKTLGIINDGTDINADTWNSIMNEFGVIEYINKNKKEIGEVLKNV